MRTLKGESSIGWVRRLKFESLTSWEGGHKKWNLDWWVRILNYEYECWLKAESLVVWVSKQGFVEGVCEIEREGERGVHELTALRDSGRTKTRQLDHRLRQGRRGSGWQTRLAFPSAAPRPGHGVVVGGDRFPAWLTGYLRTGARQPRLCTAPARLPGLHLHVSRSSRTVQSCILSSSRRWFNPVRSDSLWRRYDWKVEMDCNDGDSGSFWT